MTITETTNFKYKLHMDVQTKWKSDRSTIVDEKMRTKVIQSYRNE